MGVIIRNGRKLSARRGEVRQFGPPERKALCKRCHIVMTDIEPCYGNGEFYHKRNDCTNAGKCFGLDSPELSLFQYKKNRRANRRARKAVSKLDK